MTKLSAREIGIVGLGNMGSGIARQLMEKGWRVVGYNRSPKETRELVAEGLTAAKTPEDLVTELSATRIIWIMVPAGKPVGEIIKKLSSLLDKGDVVIDGGNSFYKDSVRHYKELAKKGIEFVDVGVSGGPKGARHGASLMVGGERELYDYLLPLFNDLSVPKGHQHFEGAGAGHFVKMVHNGIEYGMMQAIAEGFEVMKNSDYNLHLKDIAKVYNHGSVVESRLMGWMSDAFEKFGEELGEVSGKAQETGEGKWTVETAKRLGVSVKVIEESVNTRKRSREKPSYQGKVIQSLRHLFGGHQIKEL